MAASPARTVYRVSSKAVPMLPATVPEAEVMAHPYHAMARLGGATVAESRDVLLLLHPSRYCHVFFPERDIDTGLLRVPDADEASPYPQARVEDEIIYRHIEAGGERSPFAAWSYEPRVRTELAGRWTFAFHGVAYTIDGRRARAHIRDPRAVFTVTPLGKHLVAKALDVTVADSRNALRLTESGYHDRYYVPEDGIDMSLLVPSDRVTVCAYKGEARYHHVRVGERYIENAFWCYPEPRTDYAACFARIAGAHGFFTSKLSTTLDGVPDRPDESALATDRRMLANPNADRIALERAAAG